MARIMCPHCEKEIDLSHSAFVMGREGVGEEFQKADYYPDPEKAYKTSEKMRRVAMAYYWKNRKAVLARETRRRAAGPSVKVSIHD